MQMPLTWRMQLNGWRSELGLALDNPLACAEGWQPRHMRTVCMYRHSSQHLEPFVVDQRVGPHDGRLVGRRHRDRQQRHAQRRIIK